MQLKNTSFIISAAIIISMSVPAMADGSAFTPLNFDDTVYSTPASSKSITPAKSAANGLVETNVLDANSAGNTDIQNAIFKIDAALDDIRAEQVMFKGKYADVDAQYKLVKNERNMLKKQVREIDKRIKNLTKHKEGIRKTVL